MPTNHSAQHLSIFPQSIISSARPKIDFVLGVLICHRAKANISTSANHIQQCRLLSSFNSIKNNQIISNNWEAGKELLMDESELFGNI